MRRSPPPWPRAGELGLLFLSSLCLVPEVRAVTFQSVPSPNLDLSQLGRVALTGNFDSVSLYQYAGQDESVLSSDGSQSLYGRYPTGQFAQLDSSDAYIQSMCPFLAADGTMNGIIIGGNFTSFGNAETDAVVMFNPTTGAITPLPGLTGQVSSVYCDNDAQTVYVGGNFNGANSTNAIAWVTGWTNLPFAGFNGPVKSITKLSSGNIVFGGQFTGIGNLSATSTDAPISPQVVNVGSANITAQGASLNSDYNNPSDIICTTPDKIPANMSFLLQEHAPGSIKADFRFGFVPSVLRLLNTQVEGWGTKTWSYTAFPINGILNFTYYDASGVLQSCTNQCPLAQNSSYQEFHFVNEVGMNSFRIDLEDWYGAGAGLGGIEIFQNAIVSYAVDDFNSPRCDGVSNTGASSTHTGPWVVSPSGDSYSQYLTASLPHGTNHHTDASVVFLPKIQQSGNYSVNIWTPGCIADNSCATRGEVNITWDLGSSTSSAPQPQSTTLSQTNNYAKYDPIYSGYIEAGSGGFAPSFTLTPSLNQNRPLTVVANTININLTMAVASNGGNGNLNGLFEFNPNQATMNTEASNSSIDYAGTVLDDNAQILSLTMVDNSLYAAGSFKSQSFNNIMAVENGNATDLANGGLNEPVQSIYVVNGTLFAGGNFTGTRDTSITGLGNIAAYSITDRSWQAIGAGVNGIVYDIVPISINVSSTLEQAIAFSGDFTQINAFSKYGDITVSNVAIWVPSLKNWKENLDSEAIAVNGRFSAYTEVPGQDPLYGGSIDSQTLSASGAVGLTSDSGLSLQQYPIDFVASRSPSGSKVKRAAPQGEIEGVVTGLFYDESGLNLTITGGHFTAVASNGSRIFNLAIINGTDHDRITGLAYDQSANASVLALASQGTTLFVGGSFQDGILFYDLVRAQPSSVQPPGLSGSRSTVHAIALQPSTSLLYVGGSFRSAGSLGCPGLCIYDTSLQQWNPPPGALSGASTINFLQWAGNDRLILAGDFFIGGSRTKMAYFNAKTSTFTAVPNANTLPGAITAFTAIDNSFTAAFAAGTSTSNSSTFLTHFDGTNSWTTISGLGPRTVIQGLQTLALSSSHGSTNSLGSNQALLVMGQLELADYGNVSAALFNGTAFTPLVLSTTTDGSPGSIYGAFVQNPNNLLNTDDHHLALGFVVLIGLACALGAVFLLVVLGILVERIRRRRDGYVPAPTGAMMFEKSGGNVGNISPQRLFGGLGGKGGASPRL